MSAKTLPLPKASARTAVIALVTAVVVVAAALIGGEVYARHRIASCMSTQFERELGSKIDVGFGAKPLLITWMDRRLSRLDVNTAEAKFGPAVGMQVDAEFHDIELPENNSSATIIDHSAAAVSWSNAGISQTLSGLVSDVTSDPARDELTMAVLGGLGQLRVKPRIQGDKVNIEVAEAQVLGFGVPQDLAESVVAMMTESLQVYPLGLRPTALEVTDSGIDIDLTGGRTEIPPAEGNNQSC